MTILIARERSTPSRLRGRMSSAKTASRSNGAMDGFNANQSPRATAARGVVVLGPEPDGRLFVFANKRDQLALYAHPVGAEYAGFIGRIGGFQSNRVTFLAQPFQSCFLIIDQRDDNIA